MHNINSILCICLSGFGDTILAMPMLKTLRRNYPNACLHALTMWKTSAYFLQSLGIFDKVIEQNFLQGSLWSSLDVIYKLRQEHYDISVLAFPSNRAHYNFLSWLIHAKQRFGHDYLKGNPITYLRFLLTCRVRQLASTHCVQENMRLVRALGISDNGLELETGSLGQEQKDWAKVYVGAENGLVVGIHPGSSPSKNHTKRRWPVENYVSLAKAIIEDLKAVPLVFLGPNEEELKSAFEGKITDKYILSSVPIEKVTALIKSCHLFVCNDSSLGHLAAVCKVPVVSILGPTNPDYIRPWGVPHCIVTANLPCSPCFEYSRFPLMCSNQEQFACMKSISVSMVYEACKELLKEAYVGNKIIM